MSDFELMLTADSRGIVAATKDLDGVGAAADRSERRVIKSTDAMSRGMGNVGRQSIYATQQLRQTSMQLSQVAQQASATGDWLQAVAIQLPDLALGLGPIGILAGAAAGAVLSMGGSFLMAGSDADEFSDAIKRVKETAASVEGTLDSLAMSAQELSEKYGAASDAVRANLLLQAELRTAMAENSFREQSEILDDVTSRYQAVVMQGRNYAGVLANISADFGVTRAAAAELEEAFRFMSNAATFQEQQDALADIREIFAENSVEASKLPQPLQESLDKMISLSNETDAARAMTERLTNLAGMLAGSYGSAADQAFRLSAALNASRIAGGEQTARYPSRGDYSGEWLDLPEDGPVIRSRGTPELSGFPWENIGSRRRGGGGGRKSEAENYQTIAEAAERRIKALQAERDAIFMTEEAASKLRNETELFNDAQQKGIKLTDDQKGNLTTLAETMARVEEETRLAKEQQRFFDDITDDLKNGILDAIVEGDNLAETFENIGKSIAKAALEAPIMGPGPLHQKTFREIGATP